MYRLLNVPAVPIKIMMGNPAKDSQEEEVSMNLLNNPNQYVQNGYCNVNINVPMVNHTTHNLARLQELSNIIIPLVEDSTIETPDGTFHFQIDDDKGFFKDNDRDGMSYYNLRLNFQTLK